MQEESVECLAVANRLTKAKEIAKKCLETRKTPRMLFLYGGITGNHLLYEEAWELSKQSYYPAMNGLAKHYVREN